MNGVNRKDADKRDTDEVTRKNLLLYERKSLKPAQLLPLRRFFVSIVSEIFRNNVGNSHQRD
jgi:hypothetical protein